MTLPPLYTNEQYRLLQNENIVLSAQLAKVRQERDEARRQRDLAEIKRADTERMFGAENADLSAQLAKARQERDEARAKLFQDDQAMEIIRSAAARITKLDNVEAALVKAREAHNARIDECDRLRTALAKAQQERDAYKHQYETAAIADSLSAEIASTALAAEPEAEDRIASPELEASLRKAADTLSKRPVELRGPFRIKSTKPETGGGVNEIVDLSAHRPPVIYTVRITHHWNDRLEIFVEDVADDDRSRRSVADALFRAARLFGAAETEDK